MVIGFKQYGSCWINLCVCVLTPGNTTICVFCACGKSFTVCENKPFELFSPAVLNIGY